MTHLSNLDLDTLAADLPGAAASRAHLAACPACRARLDALRAEAAQARTTPAFRAGLARVAAVPAVVGRGPTRRRVRWPLVAAPLGAAALALVIALARPTTDTADGPPVPGTRAKGEAGAWLVRAGEDVPAERLRPGDVVSLRVARGGFASAQVIAIDRAGAVTPLAEGAAFRVTPGAFTLLALFSDAPLAQADLGDAVAHALAACGAQAVDASCLALPPLPGERARHVTRIDVEARP